MVKRLALTLAALLLAFATAQTPDLGPPEASEHPEGFASTIPSATLTCQAAAPRVAVLCSLERPVWAAAGFQVTLGVEGRAGLSKPVEGHLAGYVTISYDAGTWFAWVDVRTPKVAPVLGTSDVVRLGFSMQIGGL